MEIALERAGTRTGERKKREFNNKNQRQVSHVPFIELSDQTRLTENLNKVTDTKPSRIMHETVRPKLRSTFTHFMKEPVRQEESPMELLA